MATYETEREFDAPIDTVYTAFTDAGAFARWGCGTMYDNIALDIDPREGGVIHHRVKARRDGSEWTFFGVYQEVVPQEKLVYTFDWKQDWRESPEPSVVQLGFEARGDKTVLKLNHSQISGPAAESTEMHWTDFLGVLEDVLPR